MPRTVPPVVPPGRMRLARQPVLRATGGLTPGPWLPSDADVLVAACSDPGIQRWHRRRAASEDEARELIAGWGPAGGA